MKKQNRKLSNGARNMVRASEPAGAVVTAAGTSEGARKGWETRHGSVGNHGIRDALTRLGYNTKSADIRDFGTGPHATTETTYSHPDGHKATVQRKGMAPHRHVFIESSSEEHHEAADMEMRQIKDRRVSGSDADDNEKETVKAKSVIHCKASGSPLQAKKTWAVDQPIEFMWMPGGVHTIHASYGRSDGDQRPIELTVLASEEGAKQVQSAFEAIRAASPRRPPFICIEHQAKERAGEPLEFFWKTDPEPAIYCRCAPSELGCRNVNGKIHTSFSPTFDTDAEYHKMECTDCRKTPAVCACESGAGWRFPEGARGSRSLPARVTAPDVQSVGSLTNWNAFRDMLPIAARETAVKEGEAVVEAGGTSEGAKKGWESRSNHAHDLSAQADRAEQEAEGSLKGLRKAADLHHKASRAHREAGEASFNAGHKDASDVHTQASRFHYNRSIHLHNDADTAKASDTEEQKETVQAGATEPLTAESILAKHAQEQASANSVLAKARQRALGLEGKVVEAGGTSEGARKGWEARHRGWAEHHEQKAEALYKDRNKGVNGYFSHRDSGEAHRLSEAAWKSKDPKAHYKAADAHDKAMHTAWSNKDQDRHGAAYDRHLMAASALKDAQEKEHTQFEAKAATEKARAFSKKAQTEAQHLRAAELHDTASMWHEEAGDKKMAAHHAEKTDWHHRQARPHLGASDTEEQKETVQAEEKKPLTAESILARVGHRAARPLNQTRAENQ